MDDWVYWLYPEFAISLLWTIFVFAPLSIFIIKKSNGMRIALSCVLFFVRIIVLAILVDLFIDDNIILYMDIVVGVFLAVILLVLASVKDNEEIKRLYMNKNQATANNTSNLKAISKDESKTRVIHSKVISNQKEYIRDRYNLGGYDNNGYNNDGEYSNRVTLSNHSNEGVYLNREANSNIVELCTYCGEEIKSDFIYCPVCGKPIVSKMIQDTDGFK